MRTEEGGAARWGGAIQSCVRLESPSSRAAAIMGLERRPAGVAGEEATRRRGEEATQGGERKTRCGGRRSGRWEEIYP